MAAASYPMQAALRKDCILAVFPFNGGSVINPLRQTSAVYPNYNADSSGSYAVQNGLLEYSNVKITPDGFMAEDPQKQCLIYTPLDLRDNCTSKTFIARTYCSLISSEELKINPIITQGSSHGSSSIKTFALIIQGNKSLSFLNFSISINKNKSFSTTYIVDESFFDKYHNIAVVVDYDTSPGNILLNLYIDGIFIKQEKTTAFTWDHTEIADIKLVTAVRTDANNNYLSDNIVSWAMIFDSALSDDEIKAFG